MHEEFGVGTSPPPTKLPKTATHANLRANNGITSQAILTVL